MNLKQYDWRSVYESRPEDDRSYLVDEFYVPALERCTQYDRIAGYFNSGALAAAAPGIETLVENDATMRLVVGTELQAHDRPVLETLTEEFDDRFEDLDDSQLDARLTLLAHLLEEERLEIKVAEPAHGNWGVFHPKLGIFRDADGNRLSFEGSVNETRGGWELNYERFKTHRSWRSGEATYVTADVSSFRELWNDEHEFVDVYDLPEAIEEGIIEWKSPDTDRDLDDAVDRAKGEQPESIGTVADKAEIIRKGGEMPGGLHLAEEASTIEPWPHQRVVSDTAINTYPQGFLFCDEVGLGKTIEVGLTLSRLGHTSEIQNSLLLVPASLTQQWQEELWEKFNIFAYRYTREPTGDYVFKDPFGAVHDPPTAETIGVADDRTDEAWVESPVWRFVHRQQQEHDQPVVVLLSWHTARLTRYWNQLAPGDAGMGEVRTRSDVPASCRGRPTDRREGVWDTVVVDEAHNARRSTNLYGLLETLRDHTQTYYLLTATPMQLRYAELYDLCTLLGLPDKWDDRDRFADFFETRQALRTVLADRDWDPDPGLSGNIQQQQTLDGHHQSTLEASLSPSEQVFLGLSDELGLHDDARARSRLLTACQLVRAYGETYDGYQELVDEAIASADLDEFMGEDRQIKELLYTDAALEDEPWIVSQQERRTALDELPPEGWNVLQQVLSEATPVSALLHRNTRETLRKYHDAGILTETVADRKPQRRDIPLSDDAAAVYDRIDEYTEKFYKKAQEASEQETRALGFVMTIYRERLASSVAAIRSSLSRRLEKLEAQRQIVEQQHESTTQQSRIASELEGLSEDELLELAGVEDAGQDVLGVDVSEIVPGETEEGLELLEEEIEELRSFIHDAQQIALDPKIEQLRKDLQELDKRGRDRVLIFTQYTDTLDYIRDYLKQTHGENVATYSGRGGKMYDGDNDEWYPVSKEQVKQAFAAEDSGVDILIGTAAASEGLNLQKCGAVINYDLPWNPMKVEQRIGRVDRIGQEYQDIFIYHYVYDETIESDIYDRLDERINMFEDVVGELQPILSDVNQDIRTATLEGEQRSTELAVDTSTRETAETVEVNEALTGVEANEAQNVLENARLTAWQSYRHPDIDKVGEKGGRESPFTLGSVKQLVVGDLRDHLNVDCTQITADRLEEAGIDSQFAGSMYRLSLPDDIRERSQTQMPEEGTAAASLMDEDHTLVVTFDRDCANAFPSVRFLQVGDPLFSTLLSQSDRVDSPRCAWQAVGHSRSGAGSCVEGSAFPVVQTAVTPEGTPVRLDSEGGLIKLDTASGFLSEWCDLFTSTRTR